MKILIADNSYRSLWHFRGSLLRRLVDEGHEVTLVAPPDAGVMRPEETGCRYIPFPFSPRKLDPLENGGLFFRYLAVLRRVRPDVFIGYTIKPNIFGSLACRLLGIPTINVIPGRGRAYERDDWLQKLVSALYRLALKGSHRVLFLNPDDLDMFVSRGIVSGETGTYLPGEGIDLQHYGYEALPDAENGPFRFLFIGRMLKTKGAIEFVFAAQHFKRRRPEVVFQLLGECCDDDSAYIPCRELRKWHAEGIIEYLGVTEDVRPIMRDASCIVLPTFYPEGLPRVLLEGAAMGRPLIASDWPGCREIIKNEESGFLCKPRDIMDLVRQMERMLQLSQQERCRMGRKGREIVEQKFDEEMVLARYMEALAEIRGSGIA